MNSEESDGRYMEEASNSLPPPCQRSVRVWACGGFAVDRGRRPPLRDSRIGVWCPQRCPKAPNQVTSVPKGAWIRLSVIGVASRQLGIEKC